MKKIIKLCIILLVFSSCEHDIFGPNKGTIQGTVFDNFDQPVEGVVVKTVFIEDEENQTPIEVFITTDKEGNYSFEDILLTNHNITVEKKGLKTGYKSIRLTQKNDVQTHNFTLEGTPEILNYNIDKPSISITNNEEAVVSLSVTDTFNEDSTSTYFIAKCIVSRNGNSVKVFDLNLDSNSNFLFLFTTTINATDLQQGNYDISFEVLDPDGRMSSKQNTSTLSVTN